MINRVDVTQRPSVVRRDIPRRAGHPLSPRFFLGLDLGQIRDYTALVALEKLKQDTSAPIYHLRHLQRFPLGTPYTHITHDMSGLLGRDPLLNRSRLMVDGTGVGVPVVNMLYHAGLPVVPVWMTAGSTVSRKGRIIRVPKRDLVSVLQVLFQTGRLKIATSLPLGPVLVDELMNFRAKITPAGNDTYEAWRERDHDDLVLALAIAAWYAERSRHRTHTDLRLTPLSPQPA
jgi:hypothetical protein